MLCAAREWALKKQKNKALRRNFVEKEGIDLHQISKSLHFVDYLLLLNITTHTITS